MKKTKLLLISLLIFPLILSGCGKTELNYSIIERDEQHIGGDLSFEYDSDSHIATFGGEGEVVEFYDIDIARGFKEKGNRIGIKITAPKQIKDYESGIAKIGNQKIEVGAIYKQVNSNKVSEAVFYPLVDENNRKIELKITWENNTAEQTYLIIIKEGTNFAQE